MLANHQCQQSTMKFTTTILVAFVFLLELDVWFDFSDNCCLVGKTAKEIFKAVTKPSSHSRMIKRVMKSILSGNNHFCHCKMVYLHESKGPFHRKTRVKTALNRF